MEKEGHVVLLVAWCRVLKVPVTEGAEGFQGGLPP